MLASTLIATGQDSIARAGAAVSISQAVAHDPVHGIDYLAYYDETFTLTVAAREPDSTWKVIQPQQPQNDEGGRTIGWQRVTLPENGSDSHQELDMAVDSTGALHVAGAVHNQPMLYWREKSPGDLNSLTFRTELPGAAKWGFLASSAAETVVSYPHFFSGGDGETHLTFRSGVSSAANQYIYSYDAGTSTWAGRAGSAPVWNGAGSFTPSPDGYGPYPTTPAWRRDDQGGAYHVAWVWRGFDGQNSRLSYAWSRDLVSWYPGDRDAANPGEPLRLPFTPGMTTTLVDSGSTGGLVNGQIQVGFDDTNRVMLTYPRNNVFGEAKLYAARPTGWWNPPGSFWRISDLTAAPNALENVTGTPNASYDSSWSGSQALAAITMWHGQPVTVEDGRLIVRYACANPARGTVESRMFRASNTGLSGVTFGMEDLFDTRPALPREITDRDPSTSRYSLATRTASTEPFVLREADGWGSDRVGQRVRLVLRWEAGPFVADNIWPEPSRYPGDGTPLRLFLIAAE